MGLLIGLHLRFVSESAFFGGGGCSMGIELLNHCEQHASETLGVPLSPIPYPLP